MAATKTKKPSKSKAKVRGKRKPRPRFKQQYIEREMAPVSIPEIENATEAYIDAVMARKEATDDQMAARETLLGLMHKHNQETYKYDGRIVMVQKSEEKVKVRKLKVVSADENGQTVAVDDDGEIGDQ